MDALDALNCYGDNDSDEDSRDDDTEDTPRSALNSLSSSSSLPSLPKEILDMFGDRSDPRALEDATKHQGRSRSFPHVAGNWATYVYVNIPWSDELDTLNDILELYMPGDIECHAVDDIHISVSRTVPLQYHWIEPFVEDIRTKVESVNQFCCYLEDVEFYVNDEKTRSFISLKVGVGDNHLKNIVNIIDSCLEEFSLPCFYKDPSFHASCSWFLGNHVQLLDENIRRKIKLAFKDNVKGMEVVVDKLCCKSGNKHFTIGLGT